MDMDTNTLLAISGMFIGLLLGIVVQRSRFCMTAVISNWILIRDTRQLHVYLIAVMVAMIGTLLLEQSGLVAISDSAYRTERIPWVSLVLGGCMFGLGAVFAGGCIGRILVLTGEGNLGALLAVLTIALGATASYTGALESFRVWTHNLEVLQLNPGESSILNLLGISSSLFVLTLFSMLAWLIVRGRGNTVTLAIVIAGLSIGALVVAGWWVTGWMGTDEFSLQKPTSLTFAGPLANSALYLTNGSTPQNSFGVALFLGLVIGSLLSALLNRSFRLQAPEPSSILRILTGGFLMGVGAIMAGGCNIGQGLTGMSTLSVESILAAVAIFAGMYAGVKWLQYAEEHGSLWAFFHLHHSVPQDMRDLRG